MEASNITTFEKLSDRQHSNPDEVLYTHRKISNSQETRPNRKHEGSTRADADQELREKNANILRTAVILEI